MKVDARAVRAAKHMAGLVEAGAASWAPQLRELLGFQRIMDAFGEEIAFSNLVGICPEEDRDIFAEKLKDIYGRSVSPLRLGRQL
jgi:hypothetical protein